MENYLFNEFQEVTPQAWKNKIQVDLKGADYNATLLTKTREGVTIKPFYTKEDRTSVEINLPEKGFLLSQSIIVKNETEANLLALDALNRGATCIEFILEGAITIETLLKDIDLENTTLHFKLEFLHSEFIAQLVKETHAENTFIDIDIIGKLAKSGNWYQNQKVDFTSLKKILDNKNTICINCETYQNAGANITQQLAYAMAHANEYLHIFGAEIASKIHFKFSVGTNYFFEIAKLRAFRILWAALLKEYNITNTNTHILARPSKRNKTLYDYNVNMLRTTSECMSAILGGANTVSNIPYDTLFHHPNEFGERIARNQLLILQKESGLANAHNIANGTYYIESITHQLAEKSLDIFKQIEQGGGFLKQLKEGVIQKKITESANKEQAEFDKEQLILLGTNKLKNEEDKMKNSIETDPFLKIRNEKTLIRPIIEKRLAEKVEKNRLDKE